MRYSDEQTKQLQRVIRLQKDLIDGANKIILAQQRQLDTVMWNVRFNLGIEDDQKEEAGAAGLADTSEQ
jgi:hypothetical protein